MNKVIIIALLLLLLKPCYAQNTESSRFRFGLTGGFTFYSESDLEEINNKLIAALPFDVNTINNFPPGVTYGGYALIRLGNWMYLGPNYQFYTTGSRIGAKDYSGSYTFDQILTAHALSIEIKSLIVRSERVELTFDIDLGVHLAKWEMKEFLMVSEQTAIDSKTVLTALKPFVYPAVSVYFPFNKHIGTSIKAGYSFDLGGKYSLKNDSSSKTESNASFSGPRISLSFEYRL